MAQNIQYAPKKLKTDQLTTIMHIIRNRKAAKIVSVLCDKKGAYLNQIQKFVGGSKTNTVEILKSLEELRIIKSNWEIGKFKGKGMPKTRAIKSYRLSKDKEKLIDFYEPILKKIE